MANYVYDADGNRTSASNLGTTTNYVVDTSLPYASVVEEYSGTTLAARYDYGDDLIRMTQGGTPKYFLSDAINSTRTLTDANGAVTDTYVYDAFGNSTHSSGSTINNFLFNGQQYDSMLGLYFLRARYYSPSDGRFLSQDPYDGSQDQPETLHRYAYACNDPVNRSDPSGMSSNFNQGLGNRVHTIISENFVMVGVGRTRFDDQNQVWSILRLPPPPVGIYFAAGDPRNREPDMTDVTDAGRKYVYEIKPFNIKGIYQGKLDLRTNLNALNTLAPSGRPPGGGAASFVPGERREYEYKNAEGEPWIRGLPYPYGNRIVCVFPPVEGLVLYKVVDRRNKPKENKTQDDYNQVSDEINSGASVDDISIYANEDLLYQAADADAEVATITGSAAEGAGGASAVGAAEVAGSEALGELSIEGAVMSFSVAVVVSDEAEAYAEAI